MSIHKAALDEFFPKYFAPWDPEHPETSDVALRDLEVASPLARAAFEKGIGLLRVANFHVPVEQIELVIRAYLRLFEELNAISTEAPWPFLMGGPPRVVVER